MLAKGMNVKLDCPAPTLAHSCAPATAERKGGKSNISWPMDVGQYYPYANMRKAGGEADPRMTEQRLQLRHGDGNDDRVHPIALALGRAVAAQVEHVLANGRVHLSQQQ